MFQDNREYAHLLMNKKSNFTFFLQSEISAPDLGVATMSTTFVFLTSLLLPAFDNANPFVAFSLFLYRVTFPSSYRILLLC